MALKVEEKRAVFVTSTLNDGKIRAEDIEQRRYLDMEEIKIVHGPQKVGGMEHGKL